MVKLRIILAIVALTLSVLWGTADAATPTNYSKECQSWAHMVQAGEDDPIMHTIGCDDGDEANGLYARTDGECNAIARNMFRTYHNLQTIEFQVKYVESSCVNLDDGTWIGGESDQSIYSCNQTKVSGDGFWKLDSTVALCWQPLVL